MNAAPAHVSVPIPRFSSRLLSTLLPSLIFPPNISLPLTSLRLVWENLPHRRNQISEQSAETDVTFFFQSCLQPSSIDSLVTIFNVISDISSSFPVT